MSTPRYRTPQRQQMRWDPRSLDQLLPPDHRARLVWEYVQRLDLTDLAAEVKAVAGHPGRSPIDPRIVLALWLLATFDGVGSARELERRCVEHLAYEWLCGEVSVNYHTLSDFRSERGGLFDRLLTDSVASLIHADLASLDEVAQDGMKVRANAGAGSFRRVKSLVECHEAARKRLAELAEEEESGRGPSARRRAAHERRTRVEAAIAATEQLAAERAASAAKSGREPKEPRASTTDPAARLMTMADGGTRPAYNVQLATTTQGGLIVGVAVTSAGTDHGQLSPMVEQIAERFGRRPQRVLADGGFVQLADIEWLHAAEVAVYAPVKNAEKVWAAGGHPYEPKVRDGPGTQAWRVRMGTDEATERFRWRGATAEWVNARYRNWGLRQFVVRGLRKVQAVATLLALAHNLLQGTRLRPCAAT